ncbi:MAG: T9SS type A sorting domain-containing protein [Chitinophagales bacterium]
MKYSFTALFLCFTASVFAQFAPGPGEAGTTAIADDDVTISFWANGATITRGWQDIADPSLGLTTVGDEQSAIGSTDGNVVSLGDSGVAILTFPFPIYDVEGTDFAVYENGFSAGGVNEYFLELAFVEVSDDGINYQRFEAISNSDTINSVGSWGALDCSKLYNLAGKYPGGYGSPFDLEELGLDSITHIKLIDVVGSLSDDYAQRDFLGNKINDPYPTGFASSGFDLDGVAAINQPNTDITETAINYIDQLDLDLYPTLIDDEWFFLQGESTTDATISVVNMVGEQVLEIKANLPNKISIPAIAEGLYIVEVKADNRIYREKIMVR